MSKLVPFLVQHFDFESCGDWTKENYWFVKQTDFRARVSLRRNKS